LSNLLKHAERELKLIGYDDKDEYDKMAKDKSDDGAFFLDAIVWQETINDDVNHFTDKDSNRYIKSFPFTPKTFYVKVDKERNILDTEEYNKANAYYA